jgi:hypothetical protein
MRSLVEKRADDEVPRVSRTKINQRVCKNSRSFEKGLFQHTPPEVDTVTAGRHVSKVPTGNFTPE